MVERLKEAVESKSTTQVCVADEEGNLFTMTHSLGMPSGVITEGLGFMYNGCMAVFDPRPGRAGSLAPGKSRFSSMCPSIVFRGGEPYVVIGAPGGTQITMGVLQALDERAGLRDVDVGRCVGGAVLCDEQSHRREQPDPEVRYSGAGGAGV